MRVRWNLAVVLVTIAALAESVAAQSVQYRSAAGIEYRSMPDTGAIARAQIRLASDARSIERLIGLGIAQSGVRQFREAIETFTRGLRIAPNDPMLYRWRGHRYLSVREFDRAMDDLRPIIEGFDWLSDTDKKNIFEMNARKLYKI